MSCSCVILPDCVYRLACRVFFLCARYVASKFFFLRARLSLALDQAIIYPPVHYFIVICDRMKLFLPIVLAAAAVAIALSYVQSLVRCITWNVNEGDFQAEVSIDESFTSY